jgi:hypothetical protein
VVGALVGAVAGVAARLHIGTAQTASNKAPLVKPFRLNIFNPIRNCMNVFPNRMQQRYGTARIIVGTGDWSKRGIVSSQGVK